MKRTVIGVAIIALIAASFGIGYYVYTEPKTATIEFAGVTLTVELATTPSAQQQGLSGRNSMPADQGMLFVFTQAAEWGFWMHEMLFPLDIIWFNPNRQVVFIEQDLQPCTPTACPVYSPSVTALYVLEVNAGFVRANAVGLGDTFTFV